MFTSEIRNSFRSVAKERLVSPLYGSFILSWIIWNWKILYLTFFINQEMVKPQTKIDYILNYCSNWGRLFLLPVISTVFLLTVLPGLANLAYFISLYYETERRRHKEKHDSKIRLSIEDSQVLRQEKIILQKQYLEEINLKDREIKSRIEEKNELQKQLESLKLETKEYEEEEELRAAKIEKIILFEISEKEIDEELIKAITEKLINQLCISPKRARIKVEDGIDKFASSAVGKYT
jgi:hypothetical protein